jgi:hypothetical protein
VKTLTLCLALLVMSCTLAFGQAYKILYSFGAAHSDAAYPSSNLITDSTGNLCGVAFGGGAWGEGAVYELTPGTAGSWTESVLYSFCSDFPNCTDGEDPDGGLIIDSEGNLYGTTYRGGIKPCPASQEGCGVAFELSPPTILGGVWTYTNLHTFCAVGQCEDGAQAYGSLAFDSSGNIFGTTNQGGQQNDGTV